MSLASQRLFKIRTTKGVIIMVTCPICGMEFDTQEEHDKHHAEMHGGEAGGSQGQDGGEQPGGTGGGGQSGGMGGEQP